MNEASPVGAMNAAPRSGRPWIAEMVRPLADAGVGTRASFLRKAFDLPSVGGAETLEISALGLYRCFINGERVGEAPADARAGTAYWDRRLSYQTYNVAKYLKSGTNEIDIWLADGWLRSQMMWARNPIYNTWGEDIAAIAELHAAPGNGALLLKTDASWTSGALPILKSGIYFGEVYDARLEALAAGQGSAAIVLSAFDKSGTPHPRAVRNDRGARAFELASRRLDPVERRCRRARGSTISARTAAATSLSRSPVRRAPSSPSPMPNC